MCTNIQMRGKHSKLYNNILMNEMKKEEICFIKKRLGQPLFSLIYL
jgi:hypothetical protein